MAYITPNKVFAHLGRLAGWGEGLRPGPTTVEWDLSNACSLRCTYGADGACHFSHTHVKGPWARAKDVRLPMAYTDAGTGLYADPELVRRGLAEAASSGVLAVVWSGGGEPTLHMAFEEIVACGASQGLRQGLYTLGGHIGSHRRAEAIASAMDWAVVSLDCPDAASYAADKGVPEGRFYDACLGVDLLARQRREHPGFVVGVSFLLHSQNWTRAEEMLDLARRLGATYTTFRPAIEVSADRPQEVRGRRGWIPDPWGSTLLHRLAIEPDVELSLPRFASYRDWAGHGYAECYGVRLVTQVTPDGRVWICPQRRGVTALGDLRTESFGDIWARHPGHYTVDGQCRAMCRLHQVNGVLAEVYRPREHSEFV